MCCWLCSLCFEVFGPAQRFQTRLAGILDNDQRDAIVVEPIGGTGVLLVTAKIPKARAASEIDCRKPSDL